MLGSRTRRLCFLSGRPGGMSRRLFPGSRLTIDDFVSSRRARWSWSCRVSVSSPPVKCVQVKSRWFSSSSMFWKIGGFGSAPPSPSSPFLSALFWLHVMLESCSCLQGFGRSLSPISRSLDKEVIVAGSQLRNEFRLWAPLLGRYESTSW